MNKIKYKSFVNSPNIKIKIFTAFSIFLTMLFILQGCSLFKTAEKKDVEVVSTSDNLVDESQEDSSIVAEEKDEMTEDETSENEETTKNESQKITGFNIRVYYVDEQAEYLVGENREITGITKEDFIISAFNELLKNPKQINIYNIIPVGTKILGARYEDGYAFLNLSREFIDNKGDDGLIDYLIVNCIVMTITEIPDVIGILLEIEGNKIDIYGSLDVRFPVKRNEELIK